MECDELAVGVVLVLMTMATQRDNGRNRLVRYESVVLHMMGF